MVRKRKSRPFISFAGPDHSHHAATRLVLLALTLLIPGLFQTTVPAAADDSASWCAGSAQSAVPEAECRALEAFYHSMTGSGWLDNSGWLDSTAVCTEWTGVSCRGGQVSSLSLAANNLEGALPESIAELSALERLELSGNEISGVIPPELGRLADLQDLSLGGNRLEGPIPAALGRLSALTTLDLGDNLLSGLIPVQLAALDNLTQMLYLDGNQLEGPIPRAVCDLNPFLASVDYNKLDVFSTAQACDAVFPNWTATQTVPPANLSVSSMGVSTIPGTTAVRADVLLEWIPVTFSKGAGSYELFTRHLPGGEIQSRGRTADKTARTMKLTVDGDPQTYTYFVRTNTAAHTANQSPLSSADGDSVQIQEVADRALDIDPNLSTLTFPALALMIILLLAGIAILSLKRK